MIKVEHVDISGWEAAIRGMRNPMNSWDKSDSMLFDVYGDGYDILGNSFPVSRSSSNLCDAELGAEDLKLMHNLAFAGSDHGKFLRMINVTMDITAPLYWWKEFDTYKVGTVANSCSTMHKIHSKEFTLEDFSCEHLMNEEVGIDGAPSGISSIDILRMTVDMLNYYRKCFIADGKSKDDWWQMIQLLPSSYNQKRTVQLNYEVLRHIYKSRRKHKLDEWRMLCELIEEFPYFEEICLCG